MKRRIMRFAGKRLRKARCEAGVTREKLALSLGCTKKSIYLWERGMNVPGAEMLEGFAQELGKPMDYFFVEGRSDA
jgi:transcriptional regulator with XRE-family HTH domain